MIDLFSVAAEPVPTGNLVDVRMPDNGTVAPVEVTPSTSGVLLADWLRGNRADVRSWLDAVGAVRFRGFALNSAADFSSVLEAYGATPLEYRERSSPRHAVSDRIYTSTDYPAAYDINFHCENSYQAAWPLDLFFFCAQPSRTGGETPLADVQRVLERLPVAIVDEFAARGVRYTRYLGHGLGLDWRDVFQTSDKAAVDAYGKTVGIETEWIGDHLRTTTTRPAVRIHPRTGKPVWFNHAFFFHLHSQPADIRANLLATVGPDKLPFHATFGDGTAIPDDVIDAIGVAYDASSWKSLWQRGDVLMVDNMRMAHARTSYDGDRSILVAMDNIQEG